MNQLMDGRHILAEIEHRLTRDDLGLVSLMDALNDQFPHDQDDADDRVDDGARHSWRRKAVVACLILALAGMILTAILTSPPADAPPTAQEPRCSRIRPPGVVAPGTRETVSRGTHTVRGRW